MKSNIINLIPGPIYLTARWYDYKFRRKRYFETLQKNRHRVTSRFSSYKPFDDSNSIFIHIPKCAGISINRALYGNLAGGHTTLDQYINIFPPNMFISYFKFTFVRNPWDRLVSSYTFLKNGGLNSNDAKFFNRELSAFSDFDEFVRHWLTSDNILKYHHFIPQYKFIVDRYNKFSVDYIGYFENIEQDFDYIKKIVGVDQQLEKVNSINRNYYQDFYTADTIKIVAEIYKTDINIFDYKFDGPGSFVRKIDPSAIR